MPTLICSSRYTVDSQILRRTAHELEWETLRIDGNRVPDWFEPPDDEVAFFYTAPQAFDIASHFGRSLIGCNPDWTVNLPQVLLQRELRQMSLAEALETIDNHFVKHAVRKAFPAAIYNPRTLAEATSVIDLASLVHVGEPVHWKHEYRCFIANRKVMSISPYVYDSEVVTDYSSFPTVSEPELAAACSFAESVLSHPDVLSPDAFVLDVGVIAGRGWAVVECNECWASGIYACHPESVLNVLLRSSAKMTTQVSRWNFEQHYLLACPDAKR